MKTKAKKLLFSRVQKGQILGDENVLGGVDNNVTLPFHTRHNMKESTEDLFF